MTWLWPQHQIRRATAKSKSINNYLCFTFLTYSYTVMYSNLATLHISQTAVKFPDISRFCWSRSLATLLLTWVESSRAVQTSAPVKSWGRESSSFPAASWWASNDHPSRTSSRKVLYTCNHESESPSSTTVSCYVLLAHSHRTLYTGQHFCYKQGCKINTLTHAWRLNKRSK